MTRIPGGDDTPLWLSHHWPHQHDRCVSLRGRMACRRCVVLHPLALAVAVATGVWAGWPDRLDPWLLWLLPLPAVVDFVAEHRGLARASPSRLVLVTIPLGVACGRLYARWWADPGDVLTMAVVLAYGGACALVAILSASRRTAA